MCAKALSAADSIHLPPPEPPSEVRDEAAWRDQSDDHRATASMAYAVNHAVKGSGWYPHQHAVDPYRVEGESTPLPDVPPPIKAKLQAVCQRIVDFTAMRPPPDLQLPWDPYPRSSSGLYLPLRKGEPVPKERTLSFSLSMVLWSQLLVELTSGWASFRMGLSAGLVFLGPSERLCYWPRLLNAVMFPLRVAYGVITDLFLVLAIAGIKLDLKSAFRSLTLDHDHARWFGAIVNGVWMVFERAPFGASCCPAWFVHHLAVSLRRYGHDARETLAALAAFVDDLGLSAPSLEGLVRALDALVTALMRDGWWLSLSKAFLQPAMRLVYTGLLADFQSRSIRITVSKASKFFTLLNELTVPDPSVNPDIIPYAPSVASIRRLALTPGLFILPQSLGNSLSPIPALRLATSPLSDTQWTPIPSVSEIVQSPIATILVWVAVDDLIPWDLLSGLPTSFLAARSVILLLHQIPLTEPPSQWFSSEDSLAQSCGTRPWFRPLPPRPDIPQIPRSKTAPARLLPRDWATLRKVLGMLAWFQSVVPWAAAWRTSLDAAVTVGAWSVEAIGAVAFLHSVASILPTFERSMDRRSGIWLEVTVDASTMQWAAATVIDGVMHRLAGRLPLSFASLSSTAREAAGVREAIRAALRAGWRFDGVRVSNDSSPLVNAATSSSSSSEAVSSVLRTFAAWQLQGLMFDWRWSSREEGLHPLVDALTGTGALIPRWSIHWFILSALWDMAGGFEVHWCAEEDTTIASRYVTAGMPSEERSRLLEQVDNPADSGWMCTLRSAQLRRDQVAYAFPLWSELPELVERIWASPGPMCVIAPVDPEDFWGPALLALQARADHVTAITLCASIPPFEDRRKTRRDPRTLAAYWLYCKPGSLPTRLPRPQWWTPYVLTADGDVENNPGPVLGSLRGMSSAADSTPLTTSASTSRQRAATPPQRTTTPPHPSPTRTRSAGRVMGPLRYPAPISTSVLPQGRSVLAPASSVPSEPSVSGRSGRSILDPAHSTLPTTHTRPRAPPPQRHIPHPSPSATPITVAPPPPTTTPPTLTLGGWCALLLADAAGKRAPVTHPEVSQVHGPALSKAAASSALRAATGSSRPIRAIERMTAFIKHLDIADHPWSPRELDALSTHYATARLSPLPPCGWPKGKVAPTAKVVRSELSALAAASRRAGMELPPVCGPQADAFLTSKGAKGKKDHSDAFPIPLAAILAAQPPRSSPGYDAWRALVLVSAFCLRTGIIFWLHREMFILYDGGFLLVWRHSQKRSACVDDIESVVSEIGSITAARHPAIAAILRDASPGRLFPSLKADDLTTFLRTIVPNAPPGFSFRAYGARVSADHDATALNLPDDVCATLFWWKRQGGVLMRSYYSGTNIRAAFLFTERRASIRFNFLLPGSFDLSIRSAALRNWSAVGVGVSLPPLPSYKTIRDALSCISWSFITSRRLRGRRNTERARVAAGYDSDSLPSVTSQIEGRCCRCTSSISAGDESAACVRCPELVCLSCHPDLTADFRCPAHSLSKRPRSSSTKS